MSDDLNVTGVFVDEASSGHVIAGVAMSIAAFVGAASRGVTDMPVLVRSFVEFDRDFGGLSRLSPMSYAVSQFFENGGSEAIIVRVEASNGAFITDDDVSAGPLEAAKRGLWALERADLFNLLCIPSFTFDGDLSAQTRSAAARYAEKRRAMFIVDPLVAWSLPSDVTTGAASIDSATWGMAQTPNAALYFPRIRAMDPLQGGRLIECALCGAVAGVFARTDSRRGVWKAPAGMDATLAGVVELTTAITDAGNGQLNAQGVNALRTFPAVGRVVWGARTRQGADARGSEWKYVPVRRTALFIEESLSRGLTWAIFEPNDEPLWAQIRLSVGAFMHNLFRQGAFQGVSPRDAYFVKCDRETTTGSDVDLGIVNIVVGFAPLKPAEFVVIRIRQVAGQSAG